MNDCSAAASYADSATATRRYGTDSPTERTAQRNIVNEALHIHTHTRDNYREPGPIAIYLRGGVDNYTPACSVWALIASEDAREEATTAAVLL